MSESSLDAAGAMVFPISHLQRTGGDNRAVIRARLLRALSSCQLGFPASGHGPIPRLAACPLLPKAHAPGGEGVCVLERCTESPGLLPPTASPPRHHLMGKLSSPHGRCPKFITLKHFGCQTLPDAGPKELQAGLLATESWRIGHDLTV